jgi:hypothetical protein
MFVSTALVLALGASAPAHPEAATARPDVAPPVAQDQAKQDFDNLEFEFDQASTAWSKAYREASTAEDTTEVSRLLQARPEKDFARRFYEAGLKHEGTEGAFPFFAWVCNNASTDKSAIKESVMILAFDYTSDPRMATVAESIANHGSALGEAQGEVIEHLIAESTVPEVQAAALFARVQVSTYSSDEAAKKSVLADCKRILELSQDEDRRARASGILFEAERLQVGMVAPDIEGADLDGVPFKLSDYRGKVVMLDFWGDW